ncbi:MAG: hypothetical protein II400_05720 [Bacteroidaceae bacterium]|nr:hypothetical protein [Bacteroidaceae bacterium]
MKKNNLWMLAAILFCGLATVFTSCSKDDDDSGKKEGDTPTPTTTKVADRVEVKYYVSVADDMLSLFDIDINYEGPGYGKQTKKMEKTSWIIGDNLDNLSGKNAFFSLAVTVTPKAGVTIDPNKEYLLGMGSELAYLIQTDKKETLVSYGTRPTVVVNKQPGSQLTEENLKKMAKLYTNAGAATTLDVYKDYYLEDGVKYYYDKDRQITD